MPNNEFIIGSETRTITLKENVKGGNAPRSTVVAYRIEEGNVMRFLFECTDDLIISRGINYNARLYEGDVAEIFITLGKRERYLEIEVNPEGARYAVIVEYEKGERKIMPLNECPFKSDTHRVSGGWRTEIRMSYDDLKALGFGWENAYINLYRQDFREDGTLMLYAASPTYSSTFHLPEAFLPFKYEK